MGLTILNSTYRAVALATKRFLGAAFLSLPLTKRAFCIVIGMLIGIGTANAKSIQSPNPPVVDELLGKAIESSHRGKYDEAIKDITMAMESGLVPEQRPTSLKLRANMYFNNKQYGKAITDLKEALRIDPSFTHAKEGLCECYIRQNDFQKASEICAEIAKTSPEVDVQRLRTLIEAGQKKLQAK